MKNLDPHDIDLR